MFTGIIEGFGSIRSARGQEGGKRLVIGAEFGLEQTKIGDSIAVNGACLTVVAMQGRQFEVDVSPETLSVTALNRIQTGEKVNLERALRFSDRLDGHLVSGHIDGTGRIRSRETEGNAWIITITVPRQLAADMIPKGSVAVDGISLTVNDCQDDRFTVSIIPHTAKLTTIGFKAVGDPVNIETDMIGKYVKQYVVSNQSSAARTSGPAKGIDMNYLAQKGFL